MAEETIGPSALPVDRSELEEMIHSSSYGTTFVSPNVTAEETVWSFLIHESREVVHTIDEINDPGAKCVLITLSSDGVKIPILAFLFRFGTDPPSVYSLFMNPTDPSVSELLDDLSKQEVLIVEFYDEHHVARLKRDNNLRECIGDILLSLSDASPMADDTFDLVLDNLLSDNFESEALWELLSPAAE